MRIGHTRFLPYHKQQEEKHFIWTGNQSYSKLQSVSWVIFMNPVPRQWWGMRREGEEREGKGRGGKERGKKNQTVQFLLVHQAEIWWSNICFNVWAVGQMKLWPVIYAHLRNLMYLKHLQLCKVTGWTRKLKLSANVPIRKCFLPPTTENLIPTIIEF